MGKRNGEKACLSYDCCVGNLLAGELEEHGELTRDLKRGLA